MNNFRLQNNNRFNHCSVLTIFLVTLICLLSTQCVLGSSSEQDGSCSSGYAGDESESFASGANDVVVVQQSDGSLKSTAINVQIGKFSNWHTFVNSREGRVVKIYINGRRMRTTSPLIIRDGKACFARTSSGSRFRFLDTELQSLNLSKNGVNEGQFVVDSLSITIPFNMFYYDQTSRFVLTDIDGTITESDIKGHVFPVFGFSAHHEHVVEMFDKVGNNGYNVVYLTARSIASDIDTREYLFEDLQDQNHFSLPKGPVFMSPKTFAEALVDALSNPTPVKTSTIKSLLDLFDIKENVVVGAYGNKNSDTQAYMNSGVSTNIIYLVNSDGVLRRVGDGKRTSYFEHASNVNQKYPKIN